MEYHRLWWQLNRHIGRLVPSLCIEAQTVLKKSSREFPDGDGIQ
ncbi:MAG: hypothetical protein NTV93_01005 [Verrucomicrobia bacterium]|nr:hypothetical protein [Verrucomicrobiota bacterium]